MEVLEWCGNVGNGFPDGSRDQEKFIFIGKIIGKYFFKVEKCRVTCFSLKNMNKSVVIVFFLFKKK
jgi:hypothetical protein